MTAEHYVTLTAGLMASSAVVLGPILLYLVKIRNENRADHNRVTAGQATLVAQVQALTSLVVDTAATMKAHTAWEESSKYASMEQIEHLIQAVKEVQHEVRDQGEAQ